MKVPPVPFTGRMSYCLIRSLQMVLANRGQRYEVPWLECVSGEPFGFVYLRGQRPLFAVDGYQYDYAGEHLLRTLTNEYSFTGSASDGEALEALDDALKDGPVVAGMLDMGYLSYMPDHAQARGADHAVVVLAREPERVIVHDPNGYVSIPLPLADFLQAWQRDVYTGKPYGLWRIGPQREIPSDERIWESTLARARDNFTRPESASIDGAEGIAIWFGPAAMRALAEDLRTLPDIDLGVLPYFSLRVSAQRAFDSAVFLGERLPEAASIRLCEAEMYGELQQAAAAGEQVRLPELLERLADLEAAFITALGVSAR